jgi:hypothetical protein
LVIGRPQSKTLEDQMRTIKLLLFCLSAVYTSRVAAQQMIVPNQKIEWLDLQQNKTIPSVIGDLSPSLVTLDKYSVPVLAFRAISFNNEKFTQPVLSNVIASEISAAYFDQEQLRIIGEDFQVEIESVQFNEKHQQVATVIPFRRRDGKIERLLSFEISGSTSFQETKKNNYTYVSHSVLSEGDVYKIAIAKDGVYKIDRSFLESLGISVSGLDPNSINIYGNGGALLTEKNFVEKADDLVKNAIHVQGESDGIFNASDYILFYGKGPDSWTLAQDNGINRKRWFHTKHYYSDSAYYFIKINDTNPLRISTENSGEVANRISDSFQDFLYTETDQYSPAKSGREFYGDLYDAVLSGTYTFGFPNVKTTVPASMDFSAIARTIGGSSIFTTTVQGNVNTISIGNVTDSPTSQVARSGRINTSFQPTNGNFNVSVSFSKGNADAKGWIDYICMNATQELKMQGTQMRFRDTTSVGIGNITEFQISEQSHPVNEIWDITNFTSPVRMTLASAGTLSTWTTGTEQLKEFVAFASSFFTPTPIGKIENQDLHGWASTDLIIISSPVLMPVAEEIAAIHIAQGQSVQVATPIQIFNEFSSGNPDVMAFRQLVKMQYDRANGGKRAPKNLLILGDGDYSRNKGLANHEGTKVLVFESNNSLSPTSSYVSDDYFVMVSPLEDGNATGLLDCGVGRIPAGSLDEAYGYLGKIKAYVAENSSSNGGAYCLGDVQDSPFGNWRNVVTFVSDDQDGSGGAYEQVHLTSANALSNIVKTNHPEYDISKIYMDAYTQVSTPGGERYVDGEKAIQQRIQSGTLLLTYIGHGGEKGWAHERVLDIPTIESFTNKYRLPVFLTATCELARYDDPEFKSAGELLVMNANGGAIAMLTTTRIVFSGENYEMDLAFFEHALYSGAGELKTLGELNMLTKNGVSIGNDSKPNFSLLGDPALTMVYPKLNVETTHINSTELAAFTDTLKALDEVEFKGRVTDSNGNFLPNFNGFIYPTVFDKESKVISQNNDQNGEEGQFQEFYSFNKIIYRGKASVSNGEFSFKFIVPFDINYSVDSARVSYYTVSGNNDGHGFCEAFRIGSLNPNAQLNTVGPNIALYLNDSTFVSGGSTNTTPIILAKLQDENGINTVGNGVGHNLTAIIDGNSAKPIVLNDFYESDLDTYTSGEVRYPLSTLSLGNHTLTVKAWDVFNNSNEETIQFRVEEDSKVALSHLLNYPNPFTTNTSFIYEHNQACQQLDARVQIFTVSGKLVKTIESTFYATGFRGEDIPWDGKDDFGNAIGKGTYIYKLELRNEKGQRAESFQKLVILK